MQSCPHGHWKDGWWGWGGGKRDGGQGNGGVGWKGAAQAWGWGLGWGCGGVAGVRFSRRSIDHLPQTAARRESRRWPAECRCLAVTTCQTTTALRKTRQGRPGRTVPSQKLPELQGDGQDNPNNNNTPSQEWGDGGGGGGVGIGDAGSRAWLSQIVPEQPGLRKIRHGKPESYCHNLSHTHRAAQGRKDESFDVTNCQISTELRKIGKTRASTSQTVKHPQSCARSDMKDKSFDVTNCQTTTGLCQIRHERQELRRHKLSNNHRAAQNRQGRLETLHPPLQSHLVAVSKAKAVNQFLVHVRLTIHAAH